MIGGFCGIVFHKELNHVDQLAFLAAKVAIHIFWLLWIDIILEWKCSNTLFTKRLYKFSRIIGLNVQDVKFNSKFIWDCNFWLIDWVDLIERCMLHCSHVFTNLWNDSWGFNDWFFFFAKHQSHNLFFFSNFRLNLSSNFRVLQKLHDVTSWVQKQHVISHSFLLVKIDWSHSDNFSFSDIPSSWIFCDF